MVTPLASIQLKGELASLAQAQKLLSRIWAEQQLQEEDEYRVTLAMEEALSNVLRHSGLSGDELQITITYGLKDGHFVFELTDNGKPFNPLDAPPPNLSENIEERQSGGLGVFLVKHLMNQVDYQRRNGNNVLRASYKLPG